ncbi:MAG TPA: TetR family transcriptional regulator C-terminal domain-containing protein [Aestuariivirgaceae bacterium]|jgi:AcrR family transcriptional regulator
MTSRKIPPVGARRYSRKTPEIRRRLLIAAATGCIASGGIEAFTVHNITRSARVSRGLLNHYFPSKDELLVEIYRAALAASAMQATGSKAVTNSPESALSILIEANFAPRFFNRSDFRLWLSLWSEIPANARLRSAHRKLYRANQAALTSAIDRLARLRRRKVDAPLLAQNVLALVDGLWVESCLNSRALSRSAARDACFAMLAAHLGPLTQISSRMRHPRVSSARRRP